MTVAAPPTAKSIMEWNVGIAKEGEFAEVRFQLTDDEEASAWAQWLLERTEDAVDEL
jgi:hypothetical protein